MNSYAGQAIGEDGGFAVGMSPLQRTAGMVGVYKFQNTRIFYSLRPFWNIKSVFLGGVGGGLALPNGDAIGAHDLKIWPKNAPLWGKKHANQRPRPLTTATIATFA